ncbi:hypothetical protein A4D02_29050 [Niastella koreensis]|uniref:Glycosyltransferase RgtA/B/C/D-like domain-containing protein n=2 Tax=Niastella koreensis TaxID=354356 RepID=G8TRD1_NIAKG|nr:hypothetical protein [Niastella koreensis]AEW00053.1 hypothetical protein Niako_3757 [Niastella koreensis GR20-10]OQP49640.1 hypothetical protein A4D02_29050 [Niastella koreensis]
MKLATTQAICIILLFIIFYPVFFADYAYMDEAYQLWHNDDNSNFNMLFEQGRGLGALVMQKFFTSTAAINELKWIRVISFGGWVMAVIVWNAILYSWKKVFNLNERWVLFLSICLPCSISVAISIGWAGLAQVFLAFILALLSGHLLFINTYGKKGLRISVGKAILVVVLALASLSLYQPAIGAYLLPFFLCHLNDRFKKPDPVMYIGVGFYLAISLLYYILFKYSLVAYGIGASDRTTLSLDPLAKLSFFFSQPLAQAFSFNFLYNMHGIFSQAFYPVMLAAWLFSVFALERDQKLVYKFAYVGRVLCLLMLMYISVMVPRENFASYRTMLCLNLAGTMLLVDVILRLVKQSNFKNFIPYLAAGIVVVVAWCNFNLNYVSPLKKEYQAVHTYFQQNYDSSKTSIYFVRPPDNLFKKLYNQNLYKDEFGLPSTHKEWTPEPLIKQMVLEATGNRAKAQQTAIINLPVEERDSVNVGPGSIAIDVEKVLVD